MPKKSNVPLPPPPKPGDDMRDAKGHFLKGVSGNPGGRSVAADELKKICREPMCARRLSRRGRELVSDDKATSCSRPTSYRL